jgi:membrane protein YdbS with pleckstrin-like domain
MQVFRPAIRWWSLTGSKLVAHYTESVEIHEDHLTFRKGIVSRSEVVIPFSRITNYTADQNLFDRMYGVGNFNIETAGSVGPELRLMGYPYKLGGVLNASLREPAKT